MKKKIIYREPLGKQERFYLSTVYKRTKNVRRSLELCKDMYLNMVNFKRVSKKDVEALAVACEEVAMDGAFKDTEVVKKYDFAVVKEDVTEVSKWQTVSVWDGEFSPEKLRMKVFRAIVQGAVGIEYDSVYDGAITMDGKMGMLFRYIQDMNYRITQLGRTLMALTNVGVYCATDVIENNPTFATCVHPISKSIILDQQMLPRGCVIGEFVDVEGNRYLMIQNQNHNEKTQQAFSLKLKKNFRVYRVNPHDGKQILSKESVDTQKILMMPGDADLFRYQNTEEESCLIEYALKK